MRKSGAKLCGSRALNLRRVEAGIINFGQDFDWQHTPFQIGLGWMVNDRKGSFRGREALQRDSARQPLTRLAGLRLQGSEAAAGGDSVLAENTEVGLITSAVLSPSLDQSIALAMLRTEVAKPGQSLRVMFDDRPVNATVVPYPFFDPERKLSKVA
jgi:aminomethyltransferase